MNLKQETLKCLREHNKNENDIVCVCGDDFKITWKNFIDVANNADYDSGYGGQEVARDLRIIGKDFVMVRDVYDGAEWWRFIGTTPPEQTSTIYSLCRPQTDNRLSDDDRDKLFELDPDNIYTICPILSNLNINIKV